MCRFTAETSIVTPFGGRLLHLTSAISRRRPLPGARACDRSGFLSRWWFLQPAINRCGANIGTVRIGVRTTHVESRNFEGEERPNSERSPVNDTALPVHIVSIIQTVNDKKAQTKYSVSHMRQETRHQLQKRSENVRYIFWRPSPICKSWRSRHTT
jgi:hypothetical protein